MCPSHSQKTNASTVPDRRALQVLPAQIGLLYANAHTGIMVTVVAAPILGYVQWSVIPHPVVLGWLLYMLAISIGRFLLARSYARCAPSGPHLVHWSSAFAIGAGLAGVGWGVAGILLYPDVHLMHQVFLVFLLGGMMLGGASLLAPRPEAFLAFLLPTGLLPAIRLIVDGDQEHIAVGFLAAVFTLTTLMTTWRFSRTIASALAIKFENHDLVEDLRRAKDQTDALNQQLECRVQERTADLQQVTDRLRAEMDQRRRIEAELLHIRKLEALGVLAGGVAHDFNNFLTVVQVSIELAQQRQEPASPVREILHQAASACSSAVFLSSQLLTFAIGGAPIRRRVSMAALLLDAVQLSRAGSAVAISVVMPDDLWPAEVDAGQISEALHNILLNAKQAMPGGGIIEVRAENVMLGGDRDQDAGAQVRISISDYGYGIAADVLPRIFDPYFTTKPSGGGLGLATAHAIVSRHGGRLSAESKHGNGTTLIIDLPAAAPIGDALLIHSLADPKPGGLAWPLSATGRLLVMDDQQTLRVLLVHVLTSLGYEVLSARDGAQAIDLYEAATASGRGFDAIMLDLTVGGGMGGIEAARRLRQLSGSVKLIASSGYAEAPVMGNFRAYGFDDVLPKPWTLTQLSDVFQRVLVGERQQHHDPP
jgi:signal transduction histidine kinase/ActR/RegA family two-component response regulator